MVFKPDKQTGLTKDQRELRLQELRRLQGYDIDTIKSEFEIDFHIDEAKAIKLNGQIDKKIYNV